MSKCDSCWEEVETKRYCIDFQKSGKVDSKTMQLCELCAPGAGELDLDGTVIEGVKEVV